MSLCLLVLSHLVLSVYHDYAICLIDIQLNSKGYAAIFRQCGDYPKTIITMWGGGGGGNIILLTGSAYRYLGMSMKWGIYTILMIGEWPALFLVKRDLPIFKNVNCE